MKFFAKLWEELPQEKRQELVDQMVKEGYIEPSKTSTNWANIAEQLFMSYQMDPETFIAILAGAGAVVVAAGGAIAGVLAAIGPLGWAAIAAGGVYMAGADVDTVSSFIVAVNMIKTRKYIKK